MRSEKDRELDLEVFIWDGILDPEWNPEWDRECDLEGKWKWELDRDGE